MSDTTPEPPPQQLCINDLALTHYAILDESVGYNSGHGLMFVGYKPIGRVPCLAICKDREPPQLTLYFCDSDWSPIGIAGVSSVAAAKKRAEKIYLGSSKRWVEVSSEGIASDSVNK